MVSPISVPFASGALKMDWYEREEQRFRAAPISVWWDIDGCPLPETYDHPCKISDKIRAALLKAGYSGKMMIFAYGKINMIPVQVQDALQKGGIKLCDAECASIKEEDMRGKIMRRMTDDMLWWSCETPSPANYLLISHNSTRYGLPSALVMLIRKHCNILLAINREPTNFSRLSIPRRVWLWTSLSTGGSPISPQKIEDKIRSKSWHLSLTKDEIRERSGKKNKCLTSLRLTMILFKGGKRLKKSKERMKSNEVMKSLSPPSLGSKDS